MHSSPSPLTSTRPAVAPITLPRVAPVAPALPPAPVTIVPGDHPLLDVLALLSVIASVVGLWGALLALFF